MQNIRAEVLLPTKDLLPDIPFFTKVLGMRMDEIFPAMIPVLQFFQVLAYGCEFKRGQIWRLVFYAFFVTIQF